jgi:predicted nucleotidyltransferase
LAEANRGDSDSGVDGAPFGGFLCWQVWQFAFAVDSRKRIHRSARPASKRRSVMPEIDRVREALNDFDQIRLAIAFGSIARGLATDTSDLDVGVLCDGAISRDLRSAMIEERRSRWINS